MQDTWALVTGAGGEIGRETALRLAGAGANVVAVDIVGAHAEQTAHMIEAAGTKARALQLDLSHSDAVAAKIGSQSKELGGFDSVANIAGIFGEGAIESLEPDFIKQVFDINVFALFYVCKAVLPAMMERRKGAIVNLASVHAQRGEINAAAYASSKGAIISFTKSLAREKGRFGIRANVIAPGPINTAHWRLGDEGEKLEQRIKRRVQVIPLGRVGTPADVAGAVVFLLSPSADFITGQLLAVGGGEMMQ
jgi:3-oxoacyl-[acyl-carrier protein] reductase